MLLAQLTDLHIKPRGRLAYRRVDTALCLERAIAHLNAQPARIDAVLVTGDLTDAGLPEEYGLLVELLTGLRAPVFLMSGNHDARAPLRAAFPAHAYFGPDRLCYVLEEFPLRIVALDSLQDGQAAGLLGEAQLAWLDRTLAAAPDRPTLIAVHHPPFVTGIGHMDAIGLLDADALRAVVVRHPQVSRVISGHLHRPIQRLWAGTLASTAPATSHQVALDLRSEAPPQFYLEPPGYQLHAFDPATGLVSHTALVGDWPGPFPFFDAHGALID